ncbi:MAG: trypsin-like peptidase domain-containing protein, partial [Candidatus Thioglobus sp.]
MLAKKTIFAGLAALSISYSAFAANNLANIVKKVAPSVVNLTVEKNISEEDAAKLHRRGINPSLLNPYVTGSGVIINSKHGVIVTNDHVVHDSKTIVVQLKDGSRHLGKVIGEAKQFDLAVLLIQADNLHAIAPSDSDQLKVGDHVAAIGSP